MKYIKGLDFLRACAVLFVIIAHWFTFNPIDSITCSVRYLLLPMGDFGVTLFFTLSGFLITLILLNAKQQSGNKLGIVKNFVMRRALRIFPVYYFFLLLLFFAKYPLGYSEGYLKYYLTYTSNFLMMKVGNTNMGPTWSLSVEEQFYLIWPWLILFCSNIRLKYIIPCVIIVVPLLKFFFNCILGYSTFVVNLFPLSSFDAFGIGGLYALYRLLNPANSFSRNIKYYLPLAIILYFIVHIVKLLSWYHKIPPITADIIEPLFLLTWAVFSIVLIDIVVNHRYGKIVFFVENKYVLWIGKISYGMYLFHFTLPFFFGVYLSPVMYTIPYLCKISGNLFAKNFVMFLLLVLVASCSYVFFERPVMRLKDKFRYE